MIHFEVNQVQKSKNRPRFLFQWWNEGREDVGNVDYYVNVLGCFCAFGIAGTDLGKVYVCLCNFVPAFHHVLRPPCVQDWCCFPWGSEFFLTPPLMSSDRWSLSKRPTRKILLLCSPSTSHITHLVALCSLFLGFTYNPETGRTEMQYSEPREDRTAVVSAAAPRAPLTQGRSSNSAPVLPSAACTSFFLVLLPSFPHICVK